MVAANPHIIFHITDEDKPYLPILKPLLVGRATTSVDISNPSTFSEIAIKSKSKNGATIVTTSQKLLALALGGRADNPKISDYSGSYFTTREVDVLVVPPLANLVTTTTGRFILQRYLSKILAPDNWIVEPAFKWEMFDSKKETELYNFFSFCSLVAIDIETRIKDPQRVITCISFSGIQIRHGNLILRTLLVPMDNYSNVLFVRKLCALSCPKTLQNGKYDIAYLLRYNCPITNYAFDTINLFHSWLCELPKDLGFISSFMLRHYLFHKNDGKTGDIEDYYAYNAMDAYTTLFSTLALLLEFPTYATQNFLQEFPVVFPCILSEHTGIKWDAARGVELLARVEEDMKGDLQKIQTMVSCPTYNPNSSQQTVRLFAVLGSRDITSSIPADKDKVASRHPINKRIINGIIDYREGSKLRGSYFKEGIAWDGEFSGRTETNKQARVFYALNPHGTDTGRLASRESQFWCGLQIQNIPRDDEEGDTSVKEAFLSDDGFFFGEADYKQNETWGTAYLSGDTTLLTAVHDTTKDFHALNASAFFGIPYEEIVKTWYDEAEEEWLHKTLNKPLRYLSKRTNHGANYNMGAVVLLNTMGIEKVVGAKFLLNLPKHWTLIRVCEHLLATFDRTYPVIRSQWYEKVISDVTGSGLLVGPTGWTRRCFGNPKNNKRHLNSLVAHPPQSLAAKVLNKAYGKVFYQVYLPHPRDFKLHAQIHDSILFSYRENREDLAWMVKDCMKIEVPVKDTFGVTRILCVPVDLSGGGKRWSEVKKLAKSKSQKAKELEVT